MRVESSLAVAIPTVNRRDSLSRLLTDLSRQTVLPGEILIVDGGDNEDVVRQIESETGLELALLSLAPDRRTGLPAARNEAVVNCSGNLISFLDDDLRLAPNYFEVLLRAFDQPSVVGACGYITNEVSWQRDQRRLGHPEDSFRVERGRYVIAGWSRRLPSRWAWRCWLGLAPAALPGKWPCAGHGWPLSFWPPGREPVEVDYLMGGASIWRREIFEEIRFPEELAGYALYEDFVFSMQARDLGALVLHRGALCEHHHDPAGRPRPFRYGWMVTRNGYSLWRQFRSRAGLAINLRFWLVEILNAVSCIRSFRGTMQAAGRVAGGVSALLSPIRFERSGLRVSE